MRLFIAMEEENTERFTEGVHAARLRAKYHPAHIVSLANRDITDHQEDGTQPPQQRGAAKGHSTIFLPMRAAGVRWNREASLVTGTDKNKVSPALIALTLPPTKISPAGTACRLLHVRFVLFKQVPLPPIDATG